jgi:hypothetical protein
MKPFVELAIVRGRREYSDEKPAYFELNQQLSILKCALVFLIQISVESSLVMLIPEMTYGLDAEPLPGKDSSPKSTSEVILNGVIGV